MPYTMVIHKHVYGSCTRFTTMSGPLVINTLVKLIGVIRICTYQENAGESRWAYEPVLDLWSDSDPGSDSIDDNP